MAVYVRTSAVQTNIKPLRFGSNAENNSCIAELYPLLPQKKESSQMTAPVQIFEARISRQNDRKASNHT